jgi:hypothetical protein
MAPVVMRMKPLPARVMLALWGGRLREEVYGSVPGYFQDGLLPETSALVFHARSRTA